MTNPYHILGVSTFDDDKKIKAAYKKLKKHYRPKKYKDPELRALAEKKYFEIQNAYLCIQRIRAGKEPDVREAPDTEDLLSNVDFTLLERAKELIEAGDVHEADRLLMKVPTSLHIDIGFSENNRQTRKIVPNFVLSKKENLCYIQL